jgi:hypothetical protein
VEHQQQYVGIDLHRRRSVIVRMTEDGEVLECVRIANDPVALSLELAKAGPDAEVALEATYGWYWAADLLESDGARVHLVHPLGLHWDARRVKNDERDATELAHRLRRDDLPEAWIAPAGVRELRELIRYRAKLAALRTSAKAQIHAVMAKLGILPTLSDMFSAAGQVLLDGVPFEGPRCGWTRCAACSSVTSTSSFWSNASCMAGWLTTRAIRRSRRSTASGVSPPRSSWLRSGM